MPISGRGGGQLAVYKYLIELKEKILPGIRRGGRFRVRYNGVAGWVVKFSDIFSLVGGRANVCRDGASGRPYDRVFSCSLAVLDKMKVGNHDGKAGLLRDVPALAGRQGNALSRRTGVCATLPQHSGRAYGFLSRDLAASSSGRPSPLARAASSSFFASDFLPERARATP